MVDGEDRPAVTCVHMEQGLNAVKQIEIFFWYSALLLFWRHPVGGALLHVLFMLVVCLFASVFGGLNRYEDLKQGGSWECQHESHCNGEDWFAFAIKKQTYISDDIRIIDEFKTLFLTS